MVEEIAILELTDTCDPVSGSIRFRHSLAVLLRDISLTLLLVIFSKKMVMIMIKLLLLLLI
jgi:hypothetical protein